MEYGTRKQPGQLPGNEVLQCQWAELIPDQEWEIYRKAIEVSRRAGVRFLVGGAFGLAFYTGRWRNTKDIDFFVLPADREKLIHGLTEAGFEDLFSRQPYDRGWIYRATRAEVVVDIIWGMANRRADVAEEWWEHSPRASLRGEELNILAAEELLWCKLYVMQKDRCDWPDVLNLLHAQGAMLDWDHLVKQLEDDLPLLRAALTVFHWLAPERGKEMPPRLRKLLHMAPPVIDPAPGGNLKRIRLLDTRSWFCALHPSDQQLEI